MNEDNKKNAFIDAFTEKVLPFLKKHWPDTLKPVAVLCAICLTASLLLGITNEITKPIILINTQKAADEMRRELLPNADSFEEVSVNANGVTNMFKATNGEGYIITAEAKGYGGLVAVMVAFNQEHIISAVKFLDNSETPGLGKKINTPNFEAQFANKEANELSLGEIDAIAGATISSSAAVNAINNAVNVYNEQVKGEEVIELTPEELRASLLPNAGEIIKTDYTSEDILEVYKGANYGTIIYSQGKGFYPKMITVAAAFDDNGVITGIWIDSSNETEGVGTQISKPSYSNQYIGKTALDEIEAVAGATTSSDAAKTVVQKAIDAYNAIKGA